MIILIRCYHCKKLTNVIDPTITEKKDYTFEFIDVPCSWCNKNMTLSEYDIFHRGDHHPIEDKILEEFFTYQLTGIPLEELKKSCKVNYS